MTLTLSKLAVLVVGGVVALGLWLAARSEDEETHAIGFRLPTVAADEPDEDEE